MIWGLALATIGGSLLSGIIGSNAAKKAAKIQGDAAEQAVGLQAGAMQQARIDAYPWALQGAQALYKYMDLLGIPRPTNPILPDVTQGPLSAYAGGVGGKDQPTQEMIDQWNGGLQSPGATDMTAGLDFAETPGYQFQQEEGQKAIVQNMNALGLRGSGAALKALTGFSQGIANQEFNNYLNRISGVAGLGQTQTNATNALVNQGAAGIGQSLQDAGAARASGYVGAANAWGGALGQGINQLGYLYGMNQAYPSAPSNGGLPRELWPG